MIQQLNSRKTAMMRRKARWVHQGLGASVLVRFELLDVGNTPKKGMELRGREKTPFWEGQADREKRAENGSLERFKLD